MRYSVISVAELDHGVRSAWLQLLSEQALYRSPYYHPDYTVAIAQGGAPVRLLLIEQAGKLAAVLPYQLAGRWCAAPVGGGLTDYQGPVCADGLRLSPSAMLTAMRVHYMGFNHMPLARTEFAAGAWEHSRSLTLDLRGGFAAYAERLQATREASLLKKIETAERKLAKKFGALRFCFDADSAADYTALLRGKSEQFVRTLGPAHDLFAQPAIRTVIDHLHAHRQPEFAGILSTLHAGDTLIAAHFGLRTGQVLHYWFPWYDTAYAEFSPGLMLLAGCARAAAERGIEVVDLGRGEQAYKQRFASGFEPLCEGAVSAPAMLAQAQRHYRHARHGLKHSPFGSWLRRIKAR